MEPKPKATHGGAGRGQGRKPGNPDDRTRQRAVYLTDEEWQHCFCEGTSGLTGSAYVRWLVQRDMQRRNAKPETDIEKQETS